MFNIFSYKLKSPIFIGDFLLPIKTINMVEKGKYYKMLKKSYDGFYFYVKDIHYYTPNSIGHLYSIYYSKNHQYYDSTISNSEFWNNINNFEEITVDQFIMNYKGDQPLPIKSDTFHTLIF